MQTLKQATGHDILHDRNIWQPTVQAPEIEVIKFILNENVEIEQLSLNAVTMPPGFNPVAISVSKNAGDFGGDSVVGMVDYSKDSTGVLSFTTAKGMEYIPLPQPVEGWKPGYLHKHPVTFIEKGTYFINVRSAGGTAELHPRISIAAKGVTVGGGEVMNKESQLDAIESKLDYLISK